MDHGLDALRRAINRSYRMDEGAKVLDMLGRLAFTDDERTRARERAIRLIEEVRKHPGDRTLLEDFMQRYALSTDEGIALMGLAESLLRIPDVATADALIVDKITHGHWDQNDIVDKKILTTLSGWGLSFSEQILNVSDQSVFGRLVKRVGLPVIRPAIMQAVKLLGGQFVSGQTLTEALERNTAQHDLYSFDMLGEGARTNLKARDYFNHYAQAIETLGRAQQEHKDQSVIAKDSISIKLSALHPRYEEAQKERCLPVMIDHVHELAVLAKQHNIMITLDAEEADRLELSLDVFSAVFTHPDLVGFNGFGLAVQAYQKRCHAVLNWLTALARANKKIIPVRLVKGAYWDSEIKRAQERGLSGYPVYTRKTNTDVSYLVAADQMLEAPDALYPQFATHNALTISAILELAARRDQAKFEFQRLHGMGEPLYAALRDLKQHNMIVPCRIYAPVGAYQDLLPYLVRRLLENGANSSFVNHIYDVRIAPDMLVRDPLIQAKQNEHKAHPAIPLPVDLYPDRRNSVTYDLSDRDDQAHLKDRLDYYRTQTWTARLYPSQIKYASSRAVINPSNPNHTVGHVFDTTPDLIDPIIKKLSVSFSAWNAKPLAERAALLHAIADNLLKHQDELIALCVYEAGKTIPDSLAEIREAIDFCRYYAVQGVRDLTPIHLPGPVGESNTLHHEGCGVWLCISPWNFPLAIFMGQITAALMAGNCVLAKPAPQTCLIAARAVQIMLDSGLPKDVIALLPGDSEIGNALVKHPAVCGIAFTGSTATARRIQQTLAHKDGPIIPFIAETGGQNAMIVDSSALPEQVVDDVLRSGILSAGQRCSALRVLYLQDDIAPLILNMLRGALAEMQIGDPSHLATDVGPVIDEAARCRLQIHLDAMPVPLMQIDKMPVTGTFVLPTVLPIHAITDLTAEHFGPIIHVVQFTGAQKKDVIHQINAYGYGLTLGLHSRIESFIETIIKQARVGNIYVNRGMTGAIVGVQPFGGMGLSGTGPKAGGPNYLQRFTVEKAVTINLTAVGGNTILAGLD